jgi:hypothetical protein
MTGASAGQARLLAGAIRYLIDSPPVAARMAAAARASLGTRFTQAALHDALLAAYATEPVPLPGGSSNWPSLTLG